MRKIDLRRFNFQKIINKYKRKFDRGLNFQRRRRKLHANEIRHYSIFAGEIVGAILLAFLAAFCFFNGINMPGASMEPTIQNETTVLYNRASYWIGGPKANDVVVFSPSDSVSGNYSIKRVIATPGDKILIKSGKIYVNGQVFKEMESVEELDSIEFAGIAESEITLGAGEYFLLGDNRNNSEDSRYTAIGLVNRKSIKGKAWMKFEFGDFGII